GDKVRKRGNWSIYLPGSEDSMTSNQQVKSDGSSEEKIGSSSGEPLLSFDGTAVVNERLHRDLHEDVVCVNTDSTGQDLVDHQYKTSCQNLGLSDQLAIEHDALDVDGLYTVFDTTFLHDEAVKVVQSLCVKDDLDSERRIDDFDDNEDTFAASNGTIERLEIVTQNCSESGAVTAAQEAKPDPNEIASKMNEQEHESERSCRQISYASEISDGNPGSPCTTPINMPVEGHSGRMESGTPGDRRKNKNSMQLAAHKQPPENHGTSTSSVSPRGNDVNGGPPGSSSLKPFLQSQHPSHWLLENFEQQTYQKYQKRCLADRKKVGIGRSKEMNTLYKFWLDYLRKVFVRSMYDKFLKLALEDAAANYLYGLQCLFTFYSDGLEQKFRDDLYNDFEKLTLDFYEKGDLSFHHFWETREHKEPMKKRAELEKLLKEEFCTLDDFHHAKPKTEKKEPVQLTAVAEQ
ncbi:La-related protein, partial [Drosera capensis]